MSLLQNKGQLITQGQLIAQSPLSNQGPPETNNPNLFCDLLNAINFAALKHRNQRRKTLDIPYINHPIEVAYILAQAGINSLEILQAAVLHDVLEDTETTKDQLRRQFGETVTRLVEECSDNKELGAVDRKKQQIKKSAKVSDGAKLIKIADKLSNNRGLLVDQPKNWTPSRVQGYFLWSYAVVTRIGGINRILDQYAQDLFKPMGFYLLTQSQIQNKLEMYYQEFKGGIV